MVKIGLDNLIGTVAVIVIFISLFSIGIQTTGMVTDSSSVVNITIIPTVILNFSINHISFGEGSVDTGSDNATLDTLGNIINGNWTPVSQGFVLNNLGNTPVTLNLKTGRNASEFLGGTNPSYKYNVTDNGTGSCTAASVPLGAWIDVNQTGEGDFICAPLGFIIGANSVNIDLRLVIPSDARVGFSSDIFTATGTSV